MLKPQTLKSNDKIGLVCPGDRVYKPSQLVKAVKLIETMGFKPILGRHILKYDGHLAGCDEERLYDLNNFINDTSIKAIFCLTGGYGSLRLLPYIDYKGLNQNPKVVLGSQENTALILSIFKQAQITVFHAPSLLDIKSKEGFDNLTNFLIKPNFNPIVAPGENIFLNSETKYFYSLNNQAKNIQGRLYGGQLSSLISLVGTDYMPDFSDGLLFLDDENERTDILDRHFTQLYLTQTLKNIQALLFGDFKKCNSKNSPNLFSIEEIFADYINELNIPAYFNFYFNHVMPIGILSELSAKMGEIKFLEPCFE